MYRANLRWKNSRTFSVCEICENNHSWKECPYVFAVPNKQKIIKENNKYVFVEREKFYRRDSNRFNTRINQNLISILGIGFGMNNGFLRDSELNNELMNKLKGSFNTLDDSLFIDVYDLVDYMTFQRKTIKHRNRPYRISNTL